MDTGVDGTHPDLAANFDRALSRNFTTDMVDIDGACEYAELRRPGRRGRQRPRHAHRRHDGGRAQRHGPVGCRTDVSLVNVRAGQDSGYFFLSATADALTYSGDAGLDVVNMSFYVDPWLYNCKGGAPEDTPEQAAEQDVIIEAMNRALDYAHDKGVTLVAAAGQQPRGHLQPADRPHQPGLPGRHGARPHHRQRDLRRPAGRGPGRHRRLGARPVGAQGRLLELRQRPHLG